MVQWTREGIEYEADQRHAEIIVKEMGLEEGSRSLAAPGRKEGNEDDTLLEPKEASKYRALVARGNYLGQDRSDIQFTIKELSRTMGTPTQGGWNRLKRFSRYLLDKTRVVTKYVYQEEPTRITAYSDSDFAGCASTRKSTSGGLILY